MTTIQIIFAIVAPDHLSARRREGRAYAIRAVFAAIITTAAVTWNDTSPAAAY